MTLINAFAESRNIPALKLAARVGIHKVIDMAHRFGVTSNIPAYLPVALGAVEITLEEQVAPTPSFPTTASASPRAWSAKSPTPTALPSGKTPPPSTKSSASTLRAP
jgi:penicillin-binding protein 1A